jgi:hypothetical protein
MSNDIAIIVVLRTVVYDGDVVRIEKRIVTKMLMTLRILTVIVAIVCNSGSSSCL